MKEAAQCRQFDELRTGDGMVGQVILFCKFQICPQPFQTQLYIFSLSSTRASWRLWKMQQRSKERVVE